MPRGLPAIGEKLRDKIEDVMDTHGTSAVLYSIAEILQLKADHIMESWDDRPLSALFHKASLRVSRIAGGLEI